MRTDATTPTSEIMLVLMDDYHWTARPKKYEWHAKEALSAVNTLRAVGILVDNVVGREIIAFSSTRIRQYFEQGFP